MQYEEWSIPSLIAAGLGALIIALGRGWLLTPHHIDQWRSRYEEMRDDRNYWRDQAHRDQQRADEALSVRYEEITAVDPAEDQGDV